MPRAMEDYICASEDRSHYNNETYYPYGFQTPMLEPRVTIIQEIHKVEISDEQLSKVLADRMPEVKETILNELGDIITKDNIDDAITEIHGGTAADAIREDNSP